MELSTNWISLQSIFVSIITPPLGPMHSFFRRNEFKHDIFSADLPPVLEQIGRHYREIHRPYTLTYTLYFYEQEFGAPNIDPDLRLRAYGDLDPDAASLLDLKALPWNVERKHGHSKESLGPVSEWRVHDNSSDEAYRILNETHTANILKVTRRRHFAAQHDSLPLLLDLRVRQGSGRQ